MSVFEPRMLNVQSILYSYISSPQWCLAEMASLNKSGLKKDILATERFKRPNDNIMKSYMRTRRTQKMRHISDIPVMNQASQIIQHNIIVHTLQTSTEYSQYFLLYINFEDPFQDSYISGVHQQSRPHNYKTSTFVQHFSFSYLHFST